MKTIKKLSALILSITMLITMCGSLIKPSAADEVLPAEDVGTYGAYHISCYSAQLRLTFSDGIHKYLDECGFYIGTSESDLQKVSEVGSFHPETIWYTMSEWGINLEPSTTYYYKIYYVLTSDGNTYETTLKSFETAAHTEGSWEKISDSTCTTPGKSIMQCTVCNKIIDTKIEEPSGHDKGVWLIMHPATCTTEGQEARVCTTCKSVVETRASEALGHDDGVWTVTKEATCEASGEEICICTRCGEKIDSRTVESLGHDNGVWKVDFEATPDHDGQMSKYCSRCNMVLESKSFELHTHVYGHTETLIPAGCLTKGEVGKVCASCGVVYETEEIDQLDHAYSLWYKNNNGTHSRTCTRCHAVETNNCSYVDTVTAPTCTEGGYTTHTCSVCGFSYVDNYTDALGHDWSEWVDCEDGCCHERKCEREGCEATEISAHNWSDWKYNKDGKLFCNGTKTRFCPDCGATETTEAHHTSWVCQVFYPIIVFVGNIVHKLIYVVSLDWLFPELTIYPEI